MSCSRSRSTSSSSRSISGPLAPGQALHDPAPVPYRGTSSRRSRWCRGRRRCRSNAGSRSSARARGPSTSWPSTTSRASSAAARRPAERTRRSSTPSARRGPRRPRRRAGRGPLHRLLVPHRGQRRARHQEATPFFEENIKMFAPLGFVPGDPRADRGGRRSEAGSSGHLPTLRNAVKAGTWLIGPPELITEQLMEIQHKTPGSRWSTSVSPSGRPRPWFSSSSSASRSRSCRPSRASSGRGRRRPVVVDSLLHRRQKMANDLADVGRDVDSPGRHYRRRRLAWTIGFPNTSSNDRPRRPPHRIAGSRGSVA